MNEKLQTESADSRSLPWRELYLPVTWLVMQAVFLLRFPAFAWVIPGIVAAVWAAATRQGKLAAGFAILAVLFLLFSVGMALFTQGY